MMGEAPGAGYFWEETMKSSTKLFAAASTIALGIGVPFAAVAQDEVEASEARTLSKVTVTSQRRAEDAQSAPVSVQNMTAEELTELDINDPSSLAEAVTNVSIGDGTGRGRGGTQISIRGVNEARVSPVLDPGVGIYIDDVYFGRPQTAFLRLMDVERVEVLRGPQGTLFGKNAAGGAIRYISKRPNFDDVDGYVSATLGSRNRTDVKGAYNFIINDELAFRVAAASLSADGYVEQQGGGDALGDENAQFLSAKARWQPNEKLDVNLGLNYVTTDTDDGATKVIDYFGFNGAADRGGAASVRNWNGFWGGTPREYNPDIPTDLYQVTAGGLETRNQSESLGISLDVLYEFDNDVKLRAITGYRTVDEFSDRDPDGQENAYTFFDDITREGVDFWSQEVQLSGRSFEDRLNWVTGVFYSNEKPYRSDVMDRDGRNSALNGLLILNDDAQQETDSLGLFAQATYDVTDKLALTGGVRYTQDDKSFTISQDAFYDFELEAEALGYGLTPRTAPVYGSCDVSDPSTYNAGAGCVAVAQLSGGETFEAVTYRVAGEYQWTEDVMTYVAFSTGFKAGGTNDTVADIDTPFDEESIEALELGIRSEWFGDRARANVTWFTTDYSDKQITVSSIVPNSGPCVNRCTTNAGDATISGWEIETLALLTNSLTANLNVGILDAEWDSVVPGAGVTVDSLFSRAPELTIAAGLSHVTDLPGGYELKSRLNYSYTDEQNSSPQDATTLTIPSYDLVTGRVSLGKPEDQWSVSLFCTNCLDEEYIRGGAAWAGGTENTPFRFKDNGSSIVPPPGISLVNVGAPRTIAVELRKTF
ncbi:MAG: TonB-dependent receptor [Henriciella sp.]